MHTSSLLVAALCAASMGHAARIPAKRATDTTTVNLGQCSGTPQHYSQGVLYGVNGDSPPQSYVTDLGINYLSEGGAQIDQQPAGYAASLTSYQKRFAQLKGAFDRMQQVNGVTIAKMADLYGADETTSSSFVWPGDNGDYSKWDAFVTQLLNDIKSNGMAKPYVLQLEIFNEPDINYGGRPQSQFNELWRRTVVAIRKEFGSSSSAYLPIVGPSTANNPGAQNGWWDSFLQSLQANGGTAVQPDVWNWHMEGGLPNDPIPPAQNLPAYVKKYGLTTGLGLQNNEFGVREQQRPGWSAWFKARYERLHFNALRGNWASGAKLLDNLADLLIHNADGSYATTGEYQMYKFYQQMNGAPCTTVQGAKIDSYAVAKANDVSALIGSQSFAGTWTVTFTDVGKYFPNAQSVKADITPLPYNSGAAVTGYNVASTQQVNVVNNQVSVSINVANGDDAYAVRLH